MRRFWNAPRIATKPGLKAVDLFDAVADGRVKAMWIVATNPADSMPRAGRVRDALAACPFVVVSDCLAHRHHRAWPMSCCRRRAGARRTAPSPIPSAASPASARSAPPPGEARPDWWMFAEVAPAHGLGRGHLPMTGRPTSSASMPRCRRSRMMATRVFDIGALAELDDAAYDALGAGAMALPRPGAAPARRACSRAAAFPPRMAVPACVPTRYRAPDEDREQTIA